MLSMKAAGVSKAPKPRPPKALITTSSVASASTLPCASTMLSVSSTTVPSDSINMIPATSRAIVSSTSSGIMYSACSTTTLASSIQATPKVPRPPPTLLSMPAEIRDAIWTMALGERKIDIGVCERVNMKHEGHPLVEKSTELRLSSVKDLDFQVKVNEGSPNYYWHRTRKQRDEDRHAHAQSTAHSLLLVNHLISNEATFVLYNKTLFSFLHFVYFAKFLNMLGEKQRSYIKAVSFVAGRGAIPFKAWPRKVPFPRGFALESIQLRSRTHGHASASNIDLWSATMEESFLDAFQEIFLLVERMGWTVKKIPLSFTCDYNTYDAFNLSGSDHAQETLGEQLKPIFEKVEKKRQGTLERIKAITDAKEEAHAAAVAGPEIATIRKGKTQVKGVEPEHEVEEILNSRRGQGRGGPVNYLVKWADQGIFKFQRELVPYKMVQHAPKLLADFHRKYPNTLRHVSFKMPEEVEGEDVSSQ